MGVLYYKNRYLLMAKAPLDFSELKKAYPELRYDSTGLLAQGYLDKDLLNRLRAGISAPLQIVECELDGIVVDEGDIIDTLLEQHIQRGGKGILEHQTYKRFGKSTEKVYRIDKGEGTPGKQTHIHVKNKHGQLFAMNIDGTSHDHFKVQLSKHDQKALADLGFTVPVNGILEWLIPESDNRQLLCD